jgi:tape measure domain-containing protein
MAVTADTVIVELEAKLARYSAQMQSAVQTFRSSTAQIVAQGNRTADNVERRFSQMGARLDNVGRGLARSFIGPLSGIGAAFGARQIIEYADTWTRVGNKIQAALGPMGDASKVLSEIYDIAIRSRTSLETVAQAYSRVSMSSRELGLSQEDTLKLVETLTKALQLSGSTAGEVNSIVTQLTQGLGSGVLQGDELRSIRENSIVLANAIAKEFDTTVGGLKKLGEAGQLTSARVAQAILSANGEIEGSFATLNSTIAGALTNVQSAFIRYIGETDEAHSSSRRLVEALQLLAENFDKVADAGLQLAGIIAAGLLGKALLPLLAKVPLAAAALLGLGAAFRASAAGAVLLSAALGPIGLAVAAISAAVYFYNQRMGDKAAADQAAKEAAEAHDGAMTILEGAIDEAKDASWEIVSALQAEANAHLVAADAALAHARANADVQAQEAYFRNRADQSFNELMNPGWTAGKVAEEMAPVYAALDEAEERANRARAAVTRLQGLATFAPGGAADVAFGPREGTGDRTIEPTRTKGTSSADTAADRASEQIQKTIEALEHQAAQLGRTALEQARYNALEQAGIDINSDAAGKVIEAADALYYQKERIEEVNTAFQQAADVGAELFDRLIVRGEDLNDVLRDMLLQFASTTFRTGINAFAGSLAGGFGGSPAEAGGNFFTKLLGSFFGGARAGGGPVSAGKAYLVGERQAELFVPGANGAIVPQAANQNVAGQVSIAIALDGDMLQAQIVETAGPLSVQLTRQELTNVQRRSRRNSP